MRLTDTSHASWCRLTQISLTINHLVGNCSNKHLRAIIIVYNTLQFCHHIFLFNRDALVSNWDAPACKASGIEYLLYIKQLYNVSFLHACLFVIIFSQRSWCIQLLFSLLCHNLVGWHYKSDHLLSWDTYYPEAPVDKLSWDSIICLLQDEESERGPLFFHNPFPAAVGSQKVCLFCLSLCWIWTPCHQCWWVPLAIDPRFSPELVGGVWEVWFLYSCHSLGSLLSACRWQLFCFLLTH